MSLNNIPPSIVIKYAESIKDTNSFVKHYLKEYKDLCKACDIDIFDPKSKCCPDYHPYIDSALSILNVALEKHIHIQSPQ